MELPEVGGNDGATDGESDVSTRSAVGDAVTVGTSINGAKEDTGNINSEGAEVGKEVGEKITVADVGCDVANRYRDVLEASFI
jgi:hypothetical protein